MPILLLCFISIESPVMGAKVCVFEAGVFESYMMEPNRSVRVGACSVWSGHTQASHPNVQDVPDTWR